ncbi:guanine nucleotide exchange factor VAV2 [Eurytemora carolleeae]|uniref:guanine nucleotide exchange factor VAV2 n=1 Tax=Eurytemora carolleeae TaxID=1294199 RepID=UPI000C781085|nr:guanine nucleotide exchange factor VAV2 [Eurytemora carolleeae]|eukprot:XP_023339464.1 guanine nucleotide exchange factor VAV2-like [Eurytemora affinis]
MSGSDPLWRQCAVWLDKLRLIPARHPSLKPNSRPQDLLNLLRNGVILCQAAHSLDPNSIDLTKVVYSPPEDDSVEDFVCRNNIFLFLRSVVTHFDLEESFFFDPTCLYQYQDVGKVIHK